MIKLVRDDDRQDDRMECVKYVLEVMWTARKMTTPRREQCRIHVLLRSCVLCNVCDVSSVESWTGWHPQEVDHHRVLVMLGSWYVL